MNKRKWYDYELIALENGYKIERFNNVVLRRPDPLAKGKKYKGIVDASFNDKTKQWDKKLSKWSIDYNDLTFQLKQEKYKHIGIFPEQKDNWDYLHGKISSMNRPKILNLFAYTGIATMVCAKAGAEEVVHVDALKSSNEIAKENSRLSNLEKKKIRYLQDDVMKFIAREKRRGRIYDGIIMDPPSFGRGPKGEFWKIEEQIENLIFAAFDILHEDNSFMIINTYSNSINNYDIEKIVSKKRKGKIKKIDLILQSDDQSFHLRQGSTLRWESQ